MAINVDEAALDSFLAGDGEAVSSAPAEAPAAPAAEAAAPAPAVAPAPAAESVPAVPAAEAAAQSTTPAADKAVEDAVAATGQTEDKWDEKTRAYIEDLRNESAKYRKRGQRYNDVFDGYEEDAIEEWLSLANTLKSDPRAAALRFQELAEAINAAAQQEEPQVPADEAPAQETFTRADFERLMAEREQKADLDRRVAQIELDARQLGYTVGSEAYNELLWVASNIPSGSIQEAHDRLEAKYQAYYDRRVAALGGKPAPVVPDPNGGVAAPGDGKLRTFEDANKALDAWLANQA